MAFVSVPILSILDIRCNDLKDVPHTDRLVVNFSYVEILKRYGDSSGKYKH